MSAVRHIFRWDVDKTYLRTEFDSVRDLVRTARLSAEERENIPGSAALIRDIRDSAPEGHENLIYFISGSPQQLRPVLEKKFAIDGFSPDGFVLKPALSMFFRGRFRAIRSQVPYKLGALLRGRTDAPIGTGETLLGDDAESDAFIYTLYADIVAGRVSQDVLRTILKRSGAYDEQIEYIEHELEGVVHEDAIQRIIIHLDQLTPPAAFNTYFPRTVPIYNHLQTAIVLYLDGALQATAIGHVARELIADFKYDVPRLTNSAEDILRRQRLQHAPEQFDALADALVALRDDLSAEKPPKKKKARQIREAMAELLAKVAERTRHVRSRPLPKARPSSNKPIDYVELFEQEEARRDETRRAKKLATKQARQSRPPEG